MNQKKTLRLKGNALVHADCLTLLERMPSDQVTLAYLDPPWGTAIRPNFSDEPSVEPRDVYRDFMARVLQQVHRVLSNDGTLYYHHSSNSPLYLRLLLDQIFGKSNYCKEITLPTPRRPISLSGAAAHNVILVYGKTDSCIMNQLYKPMTPDLLARYNHHDDVGKFMLRSLTRSSAYPLFQFDWRGYVLPSGHSWIYSCEKLDQLWKEGKIYHDTSGSLPRLKIYLADTPEIPIGDVWDDISHQLPRNEVLEGETRIFGQQPIALLDRIIKMGTNPGDVVLDPFCGSGTTLIAAHNHERRWVGCDIAEEAYAIALKRLQVQVGLKLRVDFDTRDGDQLEANFAIIGQPYRDLVMGAQDNIVFVLDQPVSLEENRSFEFKEINGAKPVDIIKNIVDEYVVAYLNSPKGGGIFWGIRNDGIVVGVSLDREKRDDLRRLVCDKLIGIRPTLPVEMYDLQFHPVYAGEVPVQDLYVVELKVLPSPYYPEPYCTASGKYHEKTISGIREIPQDELAAWKEHRRNLPKD